jgi:hypothetical protein
VQNLVTRLLACGIQAGAADVAALNRCGPSEATPATVLLLGLPDPVLPCLMAADQALRNALLRQGWPFQVLYGDADAQLSQAMHRAQGTAPPDLRPQAATSGAGWRTMCEACSDPDCERRLFHVLNAHAHLDTGSGKP